MSFYLTLHFLTEGGAEGLKRTTIHPTTTILLDQDYSVLEQMGSISEGKAKMVIKPKPLPPQLWLETYTENGSKRTREDNYGEELTFVYAEELKKVNMSESSAFNKAVAAFIKSLPPDIPIIMVWS